MAAALAVYPSLAAGTETALVALVGGLGVACVVVALFAVWDDGLVAGASLLLLAYIAWLGFSHPPLDRSAPLVGVGLLALVELGSWSLELRDGGEERLLARISRVLLLLAATLAVSALVLAFGGVRADGGIALWVVGAAAAFALLALLTRAARVVVEEG